MFSLLDGYHCMTNIRRILFSTSVSLLRGASISGGIGVGSGSGSSGVTTGSALGAIATNNNNNNNNKGKSIMINFAKGHPNMGLLPLEGIQEAMKEAASQNNQDNILKSLNYPKSDRGDPNLLQHLSNFLKRYTENDDMGTIPTTTTTNTDDDNDDDKDDFLISTKQQQQPQQQQSTDTIDMFITHGVSHGLDILCLAQTTPGDVVLMERPTYFLVKEIFTSHGLIVKSLPMKSLGGLDVDRLEQLLVTGAIKPPPRMIYIIPTHQNPTAKTMPIQDRWKLVQIAIRFGILVAADEVYHLLDWSDQPRPARMAVLHNQMMKLKNPPSSNITNTNTTTTTTTTTSKPGCCVTVSSFTKIFAPGVRCGWIEGPKEIIDSLTNIGYISSQGGCAPFMGEIMRISLSKGISDKVLDHLNNSYKQRCELLCKILQTEPGIEIGTIPQGGYFLWIAFTGIHDTNEFAGYCESRGLKFLPGSRCDTLKDDDINNKGEGGEEGSISGLSSDSCRNWARLCFADLNIEDLEKGAHLLISLYRDYMTSRH